MRLGFGRPGPPRVPQRGGDGSEACFHASRHAPGLPLREREGQWTFYYREVLVSLLRKDGEIQRWVVGHADERGVAFPQRAGDIYEVEGTDHAIILLQPAPARTPRLQSGDG
ncbi:MAG: hypothetical protein H5T95_08405 [Firmicutes bacterium]|nr:hypothetical protein [Bacillota bacterium]